MQLIIREAKHDSVGEVPLTRSARADVDAYVQQRQAQTAAIGKELSPQSLRFVSNSNRSRGRLLTYWG
ncbi:hypothetical protein NDI45_11340 [Leptolyngbya sp. GB1-A1]|uniref:hypothetical protein n=1 Tax=Leptolyngbya sp. GB1-A1 TaxID=2933908 RepID=UPI0032993B83